MSAYIVAIFSMEKYQPSIDKVKSSASAGEAIYHFMLSYRNNGLIVSIWNYECQLRVWDARR